MMLLRCWSVHKKLPFVLAATVFVLTASIGYGFAASTTAGPARAGSGSAAINTFTVNTGSIRLRLDLFNDPARITGMSFSLNTAGLPTPETVKAQVLTPAGAPTGSWYVCGQSGGSWSCGLPAGGTAARLTTVLVGAPQFRLRIVAAQ